MKAPGAPLGDEAARDDYRGFIRRYDEGHPAEGYSDREVLHRYAAVAGQVSEAEYEAAARDAFERMEPGDWADIGERLHHGARAHGVELPDLGPAAGGRPIQAPELRAPGPVFEPSGLARLAGRLHQEPGRLRQALTSPTPPPEADTVEHGVLAGPSARAALAGITAHLVRRALAPPPPSKDQP
jgi:hypothetical protein